MRYSHRNQFDCRSDAKPLRWIIVRSLTTLALTVTAWPLSGEAQDQGPLPLRNVHPAGLLHISQHPEGAEVVADSEPRVGVLGSISNTMNREKGVFLIDAETRVVDFNAKIGVAPNLEVGAWLPLYYRGSGFTDQPIDEWHQTFGLPRGPRRRIPKDDYSFSGRNDDGTRFDLTETGTGLGNLELNAKYRFSDDQHEGGAALMPSVGLPTARSEFGAEQLDFGLTLFFDRRFGDTAVYSGVSCFHFLDESVGNLQQAPNVVQGFVGAAYSISQRSSLYLGVDAASAMIVDALEYPDYQLYLDFGGRIGITDRTQVVLGFRENPTPSEGTTDITFEVGLESQFGS
ncbi:MAG: DUF3187 family protein [Bdellovibrionota bacterium]